MKDKIIAFAQLLEADQIRGLHDRQVACQANIDNCKVKVKFGQKYVKVDVGSSGKFMVEVSTGNIFGIKAYGQIHRGHFYGTLDTINDYDWSHYYPKHKTNPESYQRGCPVLTFAPPVIDTATV